MNPVWLSQYQQGVPEQIDPDRFSSICDVFQRSVERFAERPALANLGKILTYKEWAELADRFARFLVHELQLAPGARVALMMPNLLQYPVCLFGVLQAGLTAVNVNPLYTERELAHQLNDSGAETIIVAENFAHTVSSALPELKSLRHIVVTGIGDLLGGWRGPLTNFVVRHVRRKVPAWNLPGHWRLNDALKRARHLPVCTRHPTGNDLAFLQYTGGTTGIAKGAMLSHRNMVANMLQAGEWVKPVLREGQEVVVTALPLYHVFSLTANLMLFTELGSLNLLITNPRDMQGFIKEMGHYKVTALTGVNTLFNALLKQPDFAKLDFSSWRLTLGGGMAVQHSVAEQWKKTTGVPLIEAYGLTETSPAACINPLNIPEYNGSIGLPISSTEVQIRNEQGEQVAQGEAGELFIRGPQVMQGYWQRPEETAKVLSADGFLATGDIAIMNEQGFLKLVDRKKDMILVSGFNVYPNEVEDVVAAMPGVREVACVGVPDERSGEAVKVVIVPDAPGTLSREQVLKYCHHELTGYKVPRIVEFRDELPKSNVGKILRRELRDPAPSSAR